MFVNLCFYCFITTLEGNLYCVIRQFLVGLAFKAFPYVELQPSGANYAMHYFEISQEDTQDQISAITFTRLSTHSSSLLASRCVLEFGIRR